MEQLLTAMHESTKDIVGDVKERPSNLSTSTMPLPPPSSPTSLSFPTAVHRKQSKFSLARKKQPDAVKETAEKEEEEIEVATTPQEEDAISKESSALLASMTPEEIEHAQEELRSRLRPEMIEFLKNKGAQKMRKQEQQQVTREPKERKKNPQTTPPLPTKPTQPTQPLVGRLRFNADARVVSIAPESNVPPTSVVRRDPLREDEGSVAAPTSGYSIPEICFMTRSTVPQQRVYALKVFASVLKKARSSLGVGAVLVVPPLENMQQPLPSNITWMEVWKYAVQTANVAVVLRVAFDDSHPAVVAAAAAAIAALLGSWSPQEEEVVQCSDDHPFIAWPSVPLRHLQRQDEASEWIAAPLDLSQPHEVQEEQSNEGEEQEERQVARVDPMAGLMNMQVLDRVRWVAEEMHLPGTDGYLLDILAAFCRCGDDVALKIQRTPGLMEAIVSMYTKTTSDCGGDDVNLRLKALRVLRLLLQTSPDGIIRQQKIWTVVGSQIVLPLLMSSRSFLFDSTTTTTTAALVQEALVVWRCACMYGVPLAEGFIADDVYSTVFVHLLPPPPQVPSQESAPPIRWILAREGYCTLAFLLYRRNPHNSNTAAAVPTPTQAVWVSDHCRDAIATQCIEWWRSILQSSSSSSSTATCCCLDGGMGVEVVETMAASLLFLACFDADRRSRSSDGDEGDAWLSPLLDQYIQVVDKMVSKQAMTTTPSSFDDGNNNEPSSRISWRGVTAWSELGIALVLVLAPSSSSHTEFRAQRISSLAIALYQHAINTSDGTDTDAISGLLLQPWNVPYVQQNLQLARCQLLKSRLSDGTNAGEHQHKNILPLLETALPPGADDTALQILASVLRPTPTTITTTTTMETLLQSRRNSTVAYIRSIEPRIQSMTDFDELQSFSAFLHRHPFFLLSDDSSRVVSRALLSRYAAEWLGYAAQEEEGGGESNDAKSSSLLLSVVCFKNSSMLRPIGSRLPLPKAWYVRSPPSVLDGGTDSEKASGMRIGGALMMALMFGDSGSATDTIASAIIKNSILMVFDASSNCTNGREEVWRDPFVRCLLSAVLIKYCPHAYDGGGGGTNGDNTYVFNATEIKRLVAEYCAASFGDPLFGVAVVLACFHSRLSPSLEVQLDALSELLECRALHVLPRLDMLPGTDSRRNVRWYLDPPPLPRPHSSAQAATSTIPTTTPLLLYLNALTSKECLQCLDTDCMAPSFLIHRVCLLMEESQWASVAVIVHRLSRSEQSLPVLSLVLRWSCEEARAVDYVPKERMQVVEQRLGEEAMAVVHRALEM